METAFHRIDANGDGMVDKDEFKEAFKTLKVCSAPSNQQALSIAKFSNGILDSSDCAKIRLVDSKTLAPKSMQKVEYIFVWNIRIFA